MSELYVPEKCVDCKRRNQLADQIGNLEKDYQELATKVEIIETDLITPEGILLAIARAGFAGPSEELLDRIKQEQADNLAQTAERMTVYTDLTKDCDGPKPAYRGKPGIYAAFARCGSPTLPENAPRTNE